MGNKIIRLLLFVLFILSSTILLIPYTFKDKVIKSIYYALHQNNSFYTEIENVQLNLFSDIPNLTARLNNVTIFNAKSDRNPQVCSIKKITLTINIKDLIFNDEVNIASIKVHRPAFYFQNQHPVSFISSLLRIKAVKSEKIPLNIIDNIVEFEGGLIFFKDTVEDFSLDMKSMDAKAYIDSSNKEFKLYFEGIIKKITLNYREQIIEDSTLKSLHFEAISDSSFMQLKIKNIFIYESQDTLFTNKEGFTFNTPTTPFADSSYDFSNLYRKIFNSIAN